MKWRKPRWQDSYIIRFFAFFTNFVYSTVCAGLLGRIFTSYTQADTSYRTSLIGRTMARKPGSAGKKGYRAVRRGLAQAVDDSLLIRAVMGFMQGLLRCGLRTIGLFLLVSGTYSALMYWLFTVVWGSGIVHALNLFGGLAAVLLGVLLLFSDASLGHALATGFFFGRFFAPIFGVSDETLKGMQKTGKQYYVLAVPLGMVVGALSALTTPVYLLFGLLVFLLILLVLAVPEAGVMLLLLFLPFYSFLPQGAHWLMLVTSLPLIGYVGKLLRGTRVFRLELQDLPVLAMLVFSLLSGFSVAGGAAWRGALQSVLLMAVYFLVVNTIATPRWRNRCRLSLLVSATAASLVAIVQFILAAVLSSAGSLPLLGHSVHAGFADHTTFAYFLVIAFSFALTSFVGDHKRYRLFTGFAMITVAATVVLTWVQSAMIAILAMLIVFLLVYERRTFPFVLVSGLLTPVVALLIPDKARIAALDALRADSGVAMMRGTTAGKLAGRIFFEGGSGIFSRGAGFLRLLFGLGSGGIEQFCSLYTAVPATVAVNSFNFWLYRLLEGGILGVLLPAAFFFLLYQNCFSLLHGKEKRKRFSPINGIVLVTGVLILSIFRYAWYDPAALLIFFIAAALIAADARYERERILPVDRMTDDGSMVEFDYYGGI